MSHRAAEVSELGLEGFNIRSQKGFEPCGSTEVGVTQVKPTKGTPKLGHFPSNVSVTQHEGWVSGEIGVMTNILDGSADKN